MAFLENEMSEKKRAVDDGGPAFPGLHQGMSLRDWFAGQAIFASVYVSLQEALDPSDGLQAGVWQPEELAVGAYQLADAMLTERKKRGGA